MGRTHKKHRPPAEHRAAGPRWRDPRLVEQVAEDEARATRDDPVIVATPCRCEKIGPMRWRIHAADRPPFDYWVYALIVGGVTYTDTFEVNPGSA